MYTKKTPQRESVHCSAPASLKRHAVHQPRSVGTSPPRVSSGTTEGVRNPFREPPSITTALDPFLLSLLIGPFRHLSSTAAIQCLETDIGAPASVTGATTEVSVNGWVASGHRGVFPAVAAAAASQSSSVDAKPVYRLHTFSAVVHPLSCIPLLRLSSRCAEAVTSRSFSWEWHMHCDREGVRL